MVLPLSSLFPEWKGALVSSAHERVREGLRREEQRLKNARFLVATLFSETDLDGLSEKVVAVEPRATLQEAEEAADHERFLHAFGSTWEPFEVPQETALPPFHVAVGRRSKDGFRSFKARIWIIHCSGNPLLQLLEAWLPFEAELVEWLQRQSGITPR